MHERSFIENDTIGLCDVADLLQVAGHLHTRHMGGMTVHHGIDDQARVFIVVTENMAGESLVIRPTDLGRDVLLGPRKLHAANDEKVHE